MKCNACTAHMKSFCTDLMCGLAYFQVRRLAMEVRQLASSRQITVLNGNSTQSKYHVFVKEHMTLIVV